MMIRQASAWTLSYANRPRATEGNLSIYPLDPTVGILITLMDIILGEELGGEKQRWRIMRKKTGGRR